MENKSSNGPLRVQGTVFTKAFTVKGNHRMNRLVFCNVRHTSVAGDMLVSCKRTAQAVNQGGTADSVFVYSSLTEVNSVRDFFY